MTEHRNIVLVTFDSLRADHCTPWGYERDTTPTLNQWVDEGVTFENAISPASRTNPSMAGIFTGEPLVVRDAVSNPENARRHLERHGTIAEELSDAGYTTGAFCPNAYASRYYGFDRGFDHYEDFLFDSDLYQRVFDKHISDSGLVTAIRNLRNYVLRQEAFKTWDTYIDEMVEWAESQDEPFFLWAFSLDTHFPYLTPRKHRQWSNLFDQYYYNWRCNQLIDEFDIELSEKERRKIVDIYDDSIYFGDVLLAELRERLSDFDPVFVVHGDHGEAFDERGIYGHFYPSLYEENVHVPLVVAGGGIEHETVQDPVSLLDLPEVIRRAGGIHDGKIADLAKKWVIATDFDGRNERDITAIRTQDSKYIRTEDNGTVEHELFDLNTLSADLPAPVEGGEDSPVRQLGERRAAHERELLRIREAATRSETSY
ncbi:sulfatase [Salinigranum halophilum]|uniref:sulfatase n=1 Tax=Salinigranum halophilum TaxID=2565931 RepID=UPI0010A810EF|nr:sulfatase [Salinigranum halophilum]